MNTTIKLRAVIGIQIILVILTLLFLFGIKTSSDELEYTYKTHAGILLLIFGIIGLTGAFWKTKVGFFLSLTYQYFILFILATGLIVSLSDLRASLILAFTNIVLLFSVIFFNNVEIKDKYKISSKAIFLNISSAVMSLLFSMALLLYLA